MSFSVLGLLSLLLGGCATNPFDYEEFPRKPSSLWNHRLPLAIGNDLGAADSIGLAYRKEDSAKVKYFLQSNSPKYSILNSPSAAEKGLELAVIPVDLHPLGMQILLDKLRTMKMFRRVEALATEEQGDGLMTAQLRASSQVQRALKGSDPESEMGEGFKAIVSRFVQREKATGEVRVLSGDDFAYRLEIYPAMNLVAPEYGYWERIELDVAISKRLDVPGLSLVADPRVTFAPKSSTHPPLDRYERRAELEMNVERFRKQLFRFITVELQNSQAQNR